MQYDLKQISSAIRGWQEHPLGHDPAANYRSEAVQRRLEVILTGLDDFFDHQRLDPSAFQTVNRTFVSKPASGIRRWVPGFFKDWIKSLRAG